MHGRDHFDTWYSTHAIAARFVTGIEASLAERTVRREIDRQPTLKAAAVRKFGQVFLPWRVLEPWLFESEPAKVMPEKPGAVIVLAPIVARNEGELTRKLARSLSASAEAVQTHGMEAQHG